MPISVTQSYASCWVAISSPVLSSPYIPWRWTHFSSGGQHHRFPAIILKPCHSVYWKILSATMAVSRNPIIWAKAWGESYDMNINVIVSLTSGKFLGRWNIWQGRQSSLTQKWFKEKISPRETKCSGLLLFPLRENCFSQDTKTRATCPGYLINQYCIFNLAPLMEICYLVKASKLTPLCNDVQFSWLKMNSFDMPR